MQYMIMLIQIKVLKKDRRIFIYLSCTIYLFIMQIYLFIMHYSYLFKLMYLDLFKLKLKKIIFK